MSLDTTSISDVPPKNLEISLLTRAHSTLNWAWCSCCNRKRELTPFSPCWRCCQQLCLRFMSQQKSTFQQRQSTPDLPEQDGPNSLKFSALTASTDLNEATSTALQDYSQALWIFSCFPQHCDTFQLPSAGNQDSFWYFTLQWSPLLSPSQDFGDANHSPLAAVPGLQRAPRI